MSYVGVVNTLIRKLTFLITDVRPYLYPKIKAICDGEVIDY